MVFTPVFGFSFPVHSVPQFSFLFNSYLPLPANRTTGDKNSQKEIMTSPGRIS
jgi:hypothetical protein